MTRIQLFSLVGLVATCIACGGLGNVGQVPDTHYAAPVMIKAPAQYDIQITAVSASGKMVGIGYDQMNALNVVPLYWSSPTATPVPLNNPGAGDPYYAFGVNDSGVIVGQAGVDNLISQPVIWTSPTADPTLLTLPAGFLFGFANSINDAGQIVGQISEPTNNNWVSGCIWDASLSPTKMGDSTTHPLARAITITNDGTVFGQALDAYLSPLSYPSVWNSPTGACLPLPTTIANANVGYIASVNQRTGIACTQGLSDPLSTNVTASFLWSSPSRTPIPLSSGLPHCVGDDGVIGGTDNTGSFATIWPSFHSQAVNMTTLIPVGSDWNLVSAEFQLSNGSVVGVGNPVGATTYSNWFFAQRLP